MSSTETTVGTPLKSSSAILVLRPRATKHVSWTRLVAIGPGANDVLHATRKPKSSKTCCVYNPSKDQINVPGGFRFMIQRERDSRHEPKI